MPKLSGYVAVARHVLAGSASAFLARFLAISVLSRWIYLSGRVGFSRETVGVHEMLLIPFVAINYRVSVFLCYCYWVITNIPIHWKIVHISILRVRDSQFKLKVMRETFLRNLEPISLQSALRLLLLWVILALSQLEASGIYKTNIEIAEC
jgi:hypothetical protein